MIEITEEEYEWLSKRSVFLDCLTGAGVDNWEGYNFAIDSFVEEFGEEEKIPI